MEPCGRRVLVAQLSAKGSLRVGSTLHLRMQVQLTDPLYWPPGCVLRMGFMSCIHEGPTGASGF